MLVRCALVLAIASAGCSYGDPDLNGALFKCDSAHVCPDDLTCTGSPGVCLLSGPTQDGVACDTSTCAVGKKCCIDTENPARCIDAAAECPGTQTFCDGREDCASGVMCCQGFAAVQCIRGCGYPVCTTNEDCPTAQPNCCTDDFSSTPWIRTCSLEPCS